MSSMAEEVGRFNKERRRRVPAEKLIDVVFSLDDFIGRRLVPDGSCLRTGVDHVSLREVDDWRMDHHICYVRGLCPSWIRRDAQGS